jgi:predicted transglutaminase-like cysteine proteinase
LSQRKAASLRCRWRKLAVSITIAALSFALAPDKIASQDVGDLLAGRAVAAARWQPHFIPSPFGTVQAVIYRLPNPIGTTFPHAPIYALANVDPTDTTGSTNQSLNGQFKSAIVRDERPSTPDEADVTPRTLNTPVLAPNAFVRFCIRYPEDCRATDFHQTPVLLTKTRMAELSKINRDVNLSIKPQPNPEGVSAEEWLVAPARGDCNDYAVTKRHELLVRGWPSSSLLLAEVVTQSGEHHLVLVVRTREDELVLDNLDWTIRSVSQIKYQWVRAQQPDNPKFWSKISTASVDRLAMNAPHATSQK